jgi:hypothetical protein
VIALAWRDRLFGTVFDSIARKVEEDFGAPTIAAAANLAVAGRSASRLPKY